MTSHPTFSSNTALATTTAALKDKRGSNGPDRRKRRLLSKLNAAVQAADEAEASVHKAVASVESRSKAVGLLLIEAKKLHPAVKDFEAFLERVDGSIGLKLARAYACIKIAEGRTTDEEVREKTRERVKKHRATAAERVRAAKEAAKELAGEYIAPDGGPPVSVTSPPVTETPEASAEDKHADQSPEDGDAAYLRWESEAESARASLAAFAVACKTWLPKADANEIADKLVELDQDDQRTVLATLRKVVRFVADHLRHPDRTPEEVAIVRGRMQIPSLNGWLGKTAALAALREPPSTEPSSSWAVEVVDKAGNRWRNGVRLYSKEEAEAYADTHARADVDGYVTAKVIESGDEPTGSSVFRNRKGGRVIFDFEDGTCHLLGWHVVGGVPVTATVDPIAPTPEPVAPAPKPKLSPKLRRDPLKVNWRRYGADELEDAIADAQRYGVDHDDEPHDHKESRLRQLDRMRKRLTELRATEAAIGKHVEPRLAS